LKNSSAADGNEVELAPAFETAVDVAASTDGCVESVALPEELSIELLGEAPVLSGENHAGHRGEQRARRLGNQIPPQHEHRAARRVRAEARPRLAHAHLGLQRILQILHVR
jgi:hypothetical protein